MTVEVSARHKTFGGELLYCKHASKATGTDMTFTLFLPPGAQEGPVVTLTFLAGLTCTPDNFTIKSGGYRAASELGVAIIAPDTSPRGDGVSDDPNGDYDFGLSAGFYLDATQEPFAKHYQMEKYITQDLQAAAFDTFSQLDRARQGLMGHSMGGHGALTLGLKHPDIYGSISAFAPIAHPSACQWGQKALTGYLGEDIGQWLAYDATRLMASFPADSRANALPILIDQGVDDPYLEDQLMPEDFLIAAQDAGQKVTYRAHEGYDHGYFFISTFLEDHMRFHKDALG